MKWEASKATVTEAARWFLRLRADADGDRRAFFRWLRREPQALEEYDGIEAIWEGLDELSGDPEIEAELRVPARRRPNYAPMLAAAAVLLLVLIAGGVHLAYPPVPAGETYASVRAERRNIALADGSELSLNAESKAVVKIGNRGREVHLVSGEAFFQVAKRHGMPFFVDAAGERLRVVGTGFNVRVLSKGMRLDVVEGVVRLEGRDQAEFRAGQSALIGVDAGVERLPSGEASRAIAWRSGRLELDATPLGDAVEAMNHYARRPLAFADPRLAMVRVDGVFRLNDTQTFVRALETLGLVQAVERENQILLVPPANNPHR